MNTLHVQNLNAAAKYIVGEYDLEVLTLPRIYLNKVKVNQTLNKTIEIPDAGMVKITMLDLGEGAIFEETKNDIKWVCNLSGNLSQQVFYLQPGKYRVTYRSKSLKQSIYTIEKSFVVKSNEQLLVELFK
jgi:Ca-activated chloride channel homolog